MTKQYEFFILFYNIYETPLAAIYSTRGYHKDFMIEKKNILKHKV